MDLVPVLVFEDGVPLRRREQLKSLPSDESPSLPGRLTHARTKSLTTSRAVEDHRSNLQAAEKKSPTPSQTQQRQAECRNQQRCPAGPARSCFKAFSAAASFVQ